MSTFYNLVDRNDHQHLGTFITSLTPKRIQELEKKADKMFSMKHPDAKSEILFELIKGDDSRFYMIDQKDLEI